MSVKQNLLVEHCEIQHAHPKNCFTHFLKNHFPTATGKQESEVSGNFPPLPPYK